MKYPTFLEGGIIALAASLAGSILFTALAPALSGAQLLRILISIASISYSIYLLSRSTVRVGRVTTVTAFILISALSWFFAPTLTLYLVIHLGAIWLIRSLYFYSSLFSALTDFGLTGLGLLAAIWAFMHTSSLFLAIWCFFLAQAFFVFIPTNLRSKKRNRQTSEDQFERAHSNAQVALRKLYSHHGA